MSAPENLFVVWEARGSVRELHLCPDHHRDLAASLRMFGIGCSAVPSPEPCEVCGLDGNWPDLTGRTFGAASDHYAHVTDSNNPQGDHERRDD